MAKRAGKKEPILADLHTHLNEKKISPEEWWEAAKKKKLSAIAITEHVERDPEDAYIKLVAIKPKNILLIPGMEAKTTAGHLLIYGADEGIYRVKELQKANVPIETALILVKENNLIASFAHPYGYRSDSVCQIAGEQKAKHYTKRFQAGVEYYNGMLGSANSFVFGTQWIKKMYNFFDFVEKSKKAQKLRVAKRSGKLKAQLEKISVETLERVRKGILFAQSAKFVTAGSDAHYPRTIGTAVVELRRKPKDAKDFLKMIARKEILWAGPNIHTNEPVDKLRKKELLEGLKYITKKKVRGKLKARKITKKIKGKFNEKLKGKKITKRIKRKLKGRKLAKKIKGRIKGL